MEYFEKLNTHEQKMLDIWLQYWTEGYEGYLDDVAEDYDFTDWLKEQIDFYSDLGPTYAEPYEQALAEWLA